MRALGASPHPSDGRCLFHPPHTTVHPVSSKCSRAVSSEEKEYYMTRVKKNSRLKSHAGTEAGSRRFSDRVSSRVMVRLQQTRQLRPLQNQPFAETPGTASPLVLEVDPVRSGGRMPECLPEHRQIVAIRSKPHDMPDADPLWITAPKSVGDAKRMALALAPASEEPLIPATWSQLIPDEGRHTARAADR